MVLALLATPSAVARGGIGGRGSKYVPIPRAIPSTIASALLASGHCYNLLQPGGRLMIPVGIRTFPLKGHGVTAVVRESAGGVECAAQCGLY